LGSAEEYPINKTLLKIKERKEKKMAVSQVTIPTKPIVEKKPEPKFSLASPIQSPVPKEDMCGIHNKKLEIVCIQCRQRICSKCALFGEHKHHDVRENEDVMTEIKTRTELIMTTYDQLMQQ
jgi:hypothetical protein